MHFGCIYLLFHMVPDRMGVIQPQPSWQEQKQKTSTSITIRNLCISLPCFLPLAFQFCRIYLSNWMGMCRCLCADFCPVGWCSLAQYHHWVHDKMPYTYRYIMNEFQMVRSVWFNAKIGLRCRKNGLLARFDCLYIFLYSYLRVLSCAKHSVTNIRIRKSDAIQETRYC